VRITVFIGVLCLFLALLKVDPGGASSDVGGVNDKARDQFEEGMALWKAGDREAALAAFEASPKNAAYPTPFGSFLFPRKGRGREDFREALLGPPKCS